MSLLIITLNFCSESFQKVRSHIQCFWETKPNGCLKPHCVFKHSTQRHHNNNNDLDTVPAINAKAAG